jgi:outer membrane protein TolC
MKGMKEMKGMKIRNYLILLFVVLPGLVVGQKPLLLTDAIQLATDSSLAAFKAQNLYLSGYWEYRTYQAQKKPTLALNTTLFDFNRSLTKRYNSLLDIDEYRPQQNIYSYANTTITQNLPFSGGAVYFETELSRLQNYGDNRYTQFTTVPFLLGYTQPIWGFNSYKWNKKIAPIKYEKAKRTYLQSVETTSLQVVDYYFDLLVARQKVIMNSKNLANADTLYRIGVKRQEIASLSLAEVLTLKVDVLNAKSNLTDSRKLVKNARFLFNSYLRLNEDKDPELTMPDSLPAFQVSNEEVLKIAMENNPDQLGYEQQLLESARDLEQVRRESLMTASLVASMGFNQQNSLLAKAYQNPLNQQLATITLTIPILDWGQRKGKVNVARKNYEVTRLTIEQSKIDFRQQIMMAVNNFNAQADIVKNVEETRKVAQLAYEITKQRFMIGKTDVYSLGLALSRQDQANLDYLNALRAYWKYYYTLRQLALYDFSNQQQLSWDLDKKLGIK